MIGGGLERISVGVVQNVDREAFLKHLEQRKAQETAAERLELLFERVDALEQEVKELRKKYATNTTRS